MKAGRVLIATVAGAVFAATLYSQGCGDNGTLPVDFQGNVVSVSGAASSSRERSSSERSLLVQLRPSERLGRLWIGSAVAQSGACSSSTQSALTNVLACAETARGETISAPTVTPTATINPTVIPTATGTPGTPTPGTPTPAPTTLGATPVPTFTGASMACRPVHAADCTFSTEIVLAEDGDPALVFFVEDTNRDGQASGGEPTAFLTSPLPRLCNGDVIEIPNVTIDFASEAAIAGRPVGKQIDACPPGTPTPTRIITPGATPTTTGTPPTPTPTHSYGASLNRPPSSLLAFLSSLAIAGLLLPRRRRS